jgi:NADPH2:quinone reductase
MRAIRFETFGDPSVLRLVELPAPVAGESTATGQRVVSFDLLDFYRNENRLFGVNTLNRDPAASAKVLDALAPGFVSGDYRASPIAETCGLGKAQEAYHKSAAGTAGRIVLHPQE